GLDIIFCCNLLIYLQRHLQEKVLDMLYASLKTPGYLVLGEVETLTDNVRAKLQCLDGKAKIYRKASGEVSHEEAGQDETTFNSPRGSLKREYE
ncbi:MAG: CheR family methyltransferase, partial [Candidatus Hydrogenedentota bacterium]